MAFAALRCGIAIVYATEHLRTAVCKGTTYTGPIVAHAEDDIMCRNFIAVTSNAFRGTGVLAIHFTGVPYRSVA
jgi:hypothetical protein